MEANQELFDELYRQKIRQARSMTPEQRVLASFELSDFALVVMAAGVRDQFPDADDDEVQRIICQRFERIRRLHNRRPCEFKT